MAPEKEDTLRKKFVIPSKDTADFYIYRDYKLFGSALKKPFQLIVR
jgi:hypothetical protein